MKRVNEPSIYGLERRDLNIAGAVLFVLGLGVTLLCTAIGIHWVVQQMAATEGLKSDIITFILGLGLVIVGPVLLLALAVIFPSGWWRAFRRGVAALFGTSPR